MISNQKKQKEKQKQTTYKKVRNRNVIVKFESVKLRVGINIL